MNRRWLVLLLLLGLSLALVLFGDKTPSAAAALVVRTLERQRAPLPSTKTATATAQPVLTPTARDALWDAPETRAPIVDLFAAHDWNPPAAAASSPAEPPGPASAAAPVVPPPLPFTYLGKRLEDATWEAFLGHGDRTLIVREGSMIDGTYRVESIKPPLLVLTYVPLAQQQTLAVGGTE